MPTSRTASFGPYKLDFHSGELRKFGTRVKIGEQTFQILSMLLETPGEVVPREELRKKLWADDTFVDFDHGLNSAVQRLRDCLLDSAERPQWVQTVPRRGYRFVGEVKWTDGGSSVGITSGPSSASQEGNSEAHPATVVTEQPDRTRGVFRNLGVRWVLVSVSAIALVGAALLTGKWIRDAQSAKQGRLIKSLAVLPLENFSGDPAQEYLADGMTDEIITMLAKNPALRVTSRTSVMQYKNIHRPLREIAHELGVDGILEGSVGRKGDRVHVTAQLIHAASDTHVWAESFDRSWSDVGSLQEDLAQAIAKQIGATTSISSNPERKIGPEAHDAYLLGRYYWYAGYYDKSRDSFQKAIDLQGDYAPAWSGLADSYIASVAGEEVPPRLNIPRAEAAVRKALELDSLDDGGHRSAAALQFFYGWNWEAADRESARAIELNPGLAENHHLRAYVLSALNRTDDALQEDKKAMDLDPMVKPWILGFAFLRARQFDAAQKELQLRVGALPNESYLHSFLAEVYFHNGLEEQAEQESEQAMRLDGAEKLANERHQVYSQGGARAVLEWKLNRCKLSAAKHYVSSLEIADVYARMKRTEETLRYLQLAYEERAPFLAHIQTRPDFDFVHSDPRYRRIVKGMGLTPAY